MPTEVKLDILRRLPPRDLQRFRLASRHAAAIGATALQDLKVDDIASLKKALRCFQDGGIKSLKLSGQFSDTYFLYTEVRNLMASGLKLLEVFDVSDCNGLTLNGISHLLRHMPRLKEIKLSDSLAIESIFRHFSEDLNEAALQAFAYLKQMELAQNMLTQEQITEALALVPNLTHLRLSNVDQFDDDLLSAALSGLPNLTHLHVRDCSQLTFPGLATALENAMNLTYLELSSPGDGMDQIADNELAEVLERTPRLTHLVLQGWEDINPQGLLDALSHVGGTLICLDLSDIRQLNGPMVADVLSRVPNLEQLKLSNTYQLSNTDLGNALARVPRLKHLELTGLNRLTDDGLTAALLHVERLTYLDVSRNSKLRHINLPPLNFLETLKVAEFIELESIVSLNHFPSLQNLDIHGNWVLDKERLRNSLRHLSNTLVTLDMAQLDLNDDEMPDLSDFVKLRRVNLSYNTEITDAALRYLPEIDYLNVCECYRLTDEALAAVRADKIIQY